MKNSKRRRIFAVLPASFPGSGGDGGSDYDCSVFPPRASSPYILPWQIGESRVAIPASLGQSVPLNFRNAKAVPGTGDGITDLSCGLRPSVACTALPF
jgi:hypothetical protein